MIMFIYLDGTVCYRPVHTVMAVYFLENRMFARVRAEDEIKTKTFEIAKFSIVPDGEMIDSRYWPSELSY